MHIHTPQAYIKAHTHTDIGCKGKVFSASTEVSLSVCECVQMCVSKLDTYGQMSVFDLMFYDY